MFLANWWMAKSNTRGLSGHVVSRKGSLSLQQLNVPLCSPGPCWHFLSVSGSCRVPVSTQEQERMLKCCVELRGKRGKGICGLQITENPSIVIYQSLWPTLSMDASIRFPPELWMPSCPQCPELVKSSWHQSQRSKKTPCCEHVSERMQLLQTLYTGSVLSLPMNFWYPQGPCLSWVQGNAW